MSTRERSACQDKVGFISYDVAKRVIDRQKGNYRRKVGPRRQRLMIYRCQDCGKYHIGNTIK